jgi:NAD(P)-dependent dehydrogenase (short-subunit alcohol dehydrogenase family)/anti-sigma regulatory factor (Ser/Thr protein kinase)
MGAWLRETARALGMPEALAADLEVCAHEAAENAVSYGYATGVAGEIRLRLALDEGRATLVIEDDGRPFDPLQYPLRARPARPEDVRAGGLGIALMRSLVPECRYARAGGRNVLTLIAPLASFRSRGAERRQARGAPPAGMVERRSGFDRRHDGRALGGRLFSGIPWDAAERALAGCPVRALADGEALLEPGQPNDSLFLLLSGLLKVHLPEAYAGDVIDVEPGASVGELSLLDGMPRIINIASLQSVRAFTMGAAYGASKGGVAQLTRAQAQALSAQGITANAIAPGFFATELTDAIVRDPVRWKKNADSTFIGRNGALADLRGTAVYLASRASDYVTGQVIFVDGGFSAG